MSFVRPEAKAEILRLREILIGVICIALGAYWALGVGQLLGYVGILLVILGASLCVIGYQRSRFRIGGQGPGVVQVVEGQIAYFGPLNGGTLATEAIERLALDPSGKPAHWILEHSGQPALHIPVNAEGADALFDVFSALPGIKTERLLSELHRKTVIPTVIWERNPAQIPRGRLH